METTMLTEQILNHTYDKIREIHVEKFPYMRFGQLMFNFNFWLAEKKSVDLFYVPNYKIMELFNEFVEYMESKYKE